MKLVQCKICVFCSNAMKTTRGSFEDEFRQIKQCNLNPDPIEVPETHWCGQGMDIKGNKNKDILIQEYNDEGR